MTVTRPTSPRRSWRRCCARSTRLKSTARSFSELRALPVLSPLQGTRLLTAWPGTAGRDRVSLSAGGNGWLLILFLFGLGRFLPPRGTLLRGACGGGGGGDRGRWA